MSNLNQNIRSRLWAALLAESTRKIGENLILAAFGVGFFLSTLSKTAVLATAGIGLFLVFVGAILSHIISNKGGN